ncbi:hypothetical protein PVAND_015339 [Polypedilum vanderplanki]|uniref:Glycosyltransferase family 92 protein n=1 Tax=Polypedilum vanderplanki TaxID=319348 RepID=A0A9J6BBZ4_POLVA|nr:hypothetical protein PVAND_015339 [Polypedilum vanderplanki]
MKFISKTEIFIFSTFLILCLFYLHYLTSLSIININYINFLKPRHQNISHCGRFPLLVDLNISDTNWQVTNTSNGTFYLFNAYYDDREGLQNGTVIRILALINKIDPIVKTFCQMWFDNLKEPEISEIYEYRMLWPKYWGVNDKGASPYLISCKIPQNRTDQAPEFVSLTEDRCGFANNVMEVKNKRPKNGHKKHFLISVKNVEFNDDVSMLLIEWCEILKILGVDKIEIFIVKAHQNVLKVLEFYQTEEFLKIKFIKFPHELPNRADQSWHQWSQNDLVPYHDSFYENLRLYEFMVPMDVDEFIIPIRDEDRTWQDLLKRTIEKSKSKNENFDAFPATNRYFLLKSSHQNETYDGIPKKLRFLSNIYRAFKATPNGGNAKTFMRMDRILAVHNHFPFSCIGPEKCKSFDVSLEDGHLAHYRTDCDNPECKESKLNPTKDTTLWKYKEEILKNVNETIERIKNFRKP